MTIKVSELMTKNVTTLNPDSDLTHAAELMQRGRLRHLPVVGSDGVLHGLITHRDLLRAQIELFTKLEGGDESQFVSLRADGFMTEEVATIASDASAQDAAKALLDNKFGCLPVVDDGKIVGIVTEADFLRWAMEQMAGSRSQR